MKRQNKLLVLMIVLAIILGAYFIVSRLGISDEDTASESNFIQIFNTSRDSIIKMSWSYSDNSFTLKRDDTSSDWYYPDEPEKAIDQTSASAMLSAVYSVTATSSIEPADELSAYGLDPAFMLITVVLDDGSEYQLHIGIYNSFADGYYALDNGNTEQIYIISSSVYKAFAYSIEDIIVVDDTVEETA